MDSGFLTRNGRGAKERKIYFSRDFTFLSIFFCFVAITAAAHAAEPILIVRSAGREFDMTARSFSNELADRFAIQELIIGGHATKDTIRNSIDKVSPTLIVLINNAAIKLFKEYDEDLPKQAKRIPSLSLMGVLIEKSIEGLTNASGISYEIPLVTSVVHLRAISNMPIARVGVVYREFMSGTMKTNKEYCASEEIALVERMVLKDEKEYKSIVQRHVKDLFTKENVDAIWIVNDNVFLKSDIIRDVWMPLLNKYKKPAIVGIEALMQPPLTLGPIAVVPDPVALGIQAAEMVYAASENNWEMEAKVVPPLSVYKIINVKLLADCFKGRNFTLENIDKVIQ